MERIYVRGGIPLSGSIRVGGSKNATLALMAACLLVEGKTVLRGVPDIRDVESMADILQALGADVHFTSARDLEIDASGFCRTSISSELTGQLRASFYVLGPMLAKLGAARVSQPGGCQIGARPVDLHLRGIEALGASVRVEGGIVEARAERLRGANIYLDFPSVGATTHLMTTAACADGTTVIENAAAEPEIEDLARLLSAFGAEVHGAGTSRVRVTGVPRLRGGVVHDVIPDRIEAGTYACAIAITRGDAILENAVAAHMHPVLTKLNDMDVSVQVLDNEREPGRVRIAAPRRPKAVGLIAMPHPGFPTDMQQPMAALLSISDGAAVVTDGVFENRFRYVSELQKMGAEISVEGRTAFIHGVRRLRGAHVEATDLRAGAALIVAALGAQGETAISGVEHVDRGYDDLVKKLMIAGADITRVDVESVRQLIDPLYETAS